MGEPFLYGAAQVQAGLSFLGQFRASLAVRSSERTLTMFAILAWTFPVWILAPSRLSRRGKIGAGLVAVLATAMAAALADGVVAIPGDGPGSARRSWPAWGSARSGSSAA